MNFKELQGVSKLSCVDVSDVKKKIEESKNTETCEVPNSQA